MLASDRADRALRGDPTADFLTMRPGQRRPRARSFARGDAAMLTENRVDRRWIGVKGPTDLAGGFAELPACP